MGNLKGTPCCPESPETKLFLSHLNPATLFCSLNAFLSTLLRVLSLLGDTWVRNLTQLVLENTGSGTQERK